MKKHDPHKAERAGRENNSKAEKQDDIEKAKEIAITDIFSLLAGGVGEASRLNREGALNGVRSKGGARSKYDLGTKE